MQVPAKSERRRCLRSKATVQVLVIEFPPAGISTEVPTIARGRSRDVSNTGMCLVLNQALAQGSLLRCEVALPGTSVEIPTLARVRWSQACDREFLSGIEFLL